MIRRVLVLALVVALASVASADVVWTWSGGGGTDVWETPANWTAPAGNTYTYPTEQYYTDPNAGVEFVNKDVTDIIIDGGTVVKTDSTTASNDLYLGGTDCFLKLQNSASLTVGDDMKIGRGDDGASTASRIDVLSGSTFHLNDDFTMADDSGSDCIVNVSGSSTFTVDAGFIGDEGDAEINVTSALFECRNYVRVGYKSSGTVTVDGVGAELKAGYSAHVGDGADTTGELIIANGAEANVGTRLRIGGASGSTTSGSTGTVTVSNGSTLRVGVRPDNTEEDLRVGYGLGSTGTLNVLSGSRVEAGTARTCNYGATGFWNVDGNSTVEVTGGIQLSQQAGSVSTVTVTDGSSFSSTGDRVYVGINGTTNMTVTDSTVASGTDFRVGYAATSVATLDISGTSVLNCGR
ncbi:MAG: hypothetical protein JW888_13580, partial [Pirellulales bacterium]|nr:hypothetical protein [Pirellulales bacterium]